MASEACVFVVDDDDAVRLSLKALLESAGHAVETFASGRAGLEGLAERDRGCLLLDVMLPDMSGLDVLKALKAQDCILNVILITGYGDVPTAVKAMKFGAFDFVEKPFDDEDLLTRIEDALRAQEESLEQLKSREEARSLIDRLTDREQEVFGLLTQGQPNKVIAFELGISPRTVEIHRARVMEKLQARSLSDIVRLAITAESEVSEPTAPTGRSER
ncbi:MAG: response regulator [Pseudomonadota bacterium]